jgi:hypothetical protein
MDIYNNQSSVYWIHLPEHTDIYTQGYIGVSNNPHRRLQEHKNSTDNRHLLRALSKYSELIIQTIVLIGESNFCYQYEELLRPSENIGWNINKGGSNPPTRKGWKPSLTTIAKRSASLKGIVRTEEWCYNLSEAKRGNKNGMYGLKNPCSKDKQLSICRTKNKDKIEDYKLALILMKQGQSNRAISRKLNIGLGSVCQLKHGTHLILEAFPELKQLMSSEIF